MDFPLKLFFLVVVDVDYGCHWFSLPQLSENLETTPDSGHQPILWQQHCISRFGSDAIGGRAESGVRGDGSV